MKQFAFPRRFFGQLLSARKSVKPLTATGLALTAIATSVGAITIEETRLQASSGNPAPVEVATAWQNASFPVENFQTYTSPYGYRTNPVTGQSQFHRGLDMAAPLGSYVRNWWGGTVVGLSSGSACGTMVTIQSGEWTHIYCHLMGYVTTNGQGRYLADLEGGIQIWQGQTIPVGARIGRVGMTGRTTGPHLHWGLKHSGNYIDPAVVLREMFRQQKAAQQFNARPAS